MAAAAAGRGGVELDGEPELGRVELAGGEGEARGHDADHQTGITVETNVAADDAAVATEGALPQAERQNGIYWDLGVVVGGGENAAEQGIDAEHREHAGRGVRGGSADGLGRAREIDALVDPAVESLEGVGVALE